MPLTNLKLSKLGPFEEIEFEFDRRVNVFVGPNNSGKTTALLALADALVYPFSVPERFVREGSRFGLRLAGSGGKVAEIGGSLPIATLGRGETALKGVHGETSLRLQSWRWPEKRFNELRAKTKCLGYRAFVPAMRLSTGFRSAGPATREGPASVVLPAGIAPSPRASFAADVARSLQESDAASSYVVDRHIVQQIVDLDYRAYRENKPAIRRVIELIADLVSDVTEGFAVRFAGVGQDRGGLFPRFETPDGVVPMDVLSQGTQSLIQWCARLAIGYAEYYKFPQSLAQKPGILLVDEIDAHLHPSWQRRILPAITKRFPSLQIFAAAHSPMTLAGLSAGQVHLLRRDERGAVRVTRNESDILGWTADEIYGSFFGLEPTDLQTSQQLERMTELRSKAKLTRVERREIDVLRGKIAERLSAGPEAWKSEELAEQLRTAARRSTASNGSHGSRRVQRHGGSGARSHTRA